MLIAAIDPTLSSMQTKQAWIVEMTTPTDRMRKGNASTHSSQGDTKAASIWLRLTATDSWSSPLRLKTLVTEPSLKLGLRAAWFAPWGPDSGWSSIMLPSIKEDGLRRWFGKPDARCFTFRLILQTWTRSRPVGLGLRVASATVWANSIACRDAMEHILKLAS